MADSKENSQFMVRKKGQFCIDCTDVRLVYLSPGPVEEAEDGFGGTVPVRKPMTCVVFDDCPTVFSFPGNHVDEIADMMRYAAENESSDEEE